MVCRSSTFTVGRTSSRKKKSDYQLCLTADISDAAVVPTRTGGPLAALGGGEAGFGPPAPSAAQTDPRTLRGDDGAGQWWGGGRHPGLVRVHPEIQGCNNKMVPQTSL